MPVQIIEENAENIFLLSLDQSSEMTLKHSVLHCQFSRLKIAAKPLALLPVLNDIMGGENAAAYFCYDGDVIITWKGFHNQILMGLTTTLSMIFKDKITDALKDKVFHYYEPYQDKEALRALCRGKQIQRDVEKSRASPAGTAAPIRKAPPAYPELALTPEQTTALNDAIEARHMRKSGEILVVEDHIYSCELMAGMLMQRYRSRQAHTVDQAVKLFSTYAPNICFLDIYLPDGSGHALAALIKAQDPRCLVIMVSGSSQMEDVQAAQKNGVHGYIMKPFSTSKVFEAIELAKKVSASHKARRGSRAAAQGF